MALSSRLALDGECALLPAIGVPTHGAVDLVDAFLRDGELDGAGLTELHLLTLDQVTVAGEVAHYKGVRPAGTGVLQLDRDGAGLDAQLLWLKVVLVWPLPRLDVQRLHHRCRGGGGWRDGGGRRRGGGWGGRLGRVIGA